MKNVSIKIKETPNQSQGVINAEGNGVVVSGSQGLMTTSGQNVVFATPNQSFTQVYDSFTPTLNDCVIFNNDP